MSEIVTGTESAIGKRIDNTALASEPGIELGIPGIEAATEIGVGASAIVYRATQKSLNRPVAIKVLSVTEPDFVRRFQREAELLGKLSQSLGIVTIHDFGVTRTGQPYLILQLCDRSLFDLINENQRIEPHEAARIASSVAKALGDAHRQSVVHRDLKPANILISGSDYLVSDFGTSIVTGSTSGSTASISFTAGYVAPETFHGGQADYPIDVYALGATLFHMVSGKAPFVSDAGESNIFALANRIASEPVPDLRGLGVPDALCSLIESAMAKDPAARPRIDELKAKLDSFAAINPGLGDTAESDAFGLAKAGPTTIAPLVAVPVGLMGESPVAGPAIGDSSVGVATASLASQPFGGILSGGALPAVAPPTAGGQVFGNGPQSRSMPPVEVPAPLGSPGNPSPTTSRRGRGLLIAAAVVSLAAAGLVGLVQSGWLDPSEFALGGPGSNPSGDGDLAVVGEGQGGDAGAGGIPVPGGDFEEPEGPETIRDDETNPDGDPGDYLGDGLGGGHDEESPDGPIQDQPVVVVDIEPEPEPPVVDIPDEEKPEVTYVAVPDLYALSPDEAEQVLANHNLAVAVAYVAGEDLIGLVRQQTPSPGESVEEGTTVFVDVEANPAGFAISADSHSADAGDTINVPVTHVTGGTVQLSFTGACGSATGPLIGSSDFVATFVVETTGPSTCLVTGSIDPDHGYLASADQSVSISINELGLVAQTT